jgi:hypothetical protein
LSDSAVLAQGKSQDKYAVKVPGGLAFAEFKGFEGWELVSISQDGPVMAAILDGCNPRESRDDHRL